MRDINMNTRIYYYQNGTTSNIDKTCQSVFEKYNICSTTDKTKALLYIPYTYDDEYKEIDMMPMYSDRYYFILSNIYLFIGKENLWKMLYSYYEEAALELIPLSYDIYSEIDTFTKNFDSNKKYILKKNSQCQDNIVISSSYEDIIKLALDKEKKYVIIQELLQNPYLVLKRKINLRVYMLLICRKGRLEMYLYGDGFIYYTPEFYISNSDNNAHNITTGYIDRSVYETNPLTHLNLKTHMGENQYDILSSRIETLMTKIIKVYALSLEESQPFKDSTMFELFGCDIAVNSDLSVKIMEINKGPDLGPKSPEDAKLKYGLVEDMLKITQILTSNKDDKDDKDEPNLFKRIFF